MKTQFRYCLSIVFVLALTALTGPASSDTLFVVELDGTQVDPPTGSSATATGWFLLNDARTAIEYQISYTNLSSNFQASHVHRPASAPGSPIVVDLGSQKPLNGIWQFPLPIDIKDLFDGTLYVNIHTENYPLGEIKGTILQDGVPVETTTWSRIKAMYND